jgi:hypothetical protein
VRLPWRRESLPPALAGRLEADELITAMAQADDGHSLLTTRRGLWVVDGERAERLGWERVAKARLELGVLTLVPLDDVSLPAGVDVRPRLPEGVDMPPLPADMDAGPGMAVVRDGRPWAYRLGRPAKVTDQVHTRVRRSVAASRHLPWPGAGGWVALRRVPGRDGLLVQLRLDPAADPLAPGFLPAVRHVAAELRAAPALGTTGAD